MGGPVRRGEGRTTREVIADLHHRVMPSWLRDRGYRFGILAADCVEPPHVHVRGHGGVAKIWLATLGVASIKGYNRRELAVVLSIVFEYRLLFLEKWREFCGPIVKG